MEWVWLTVGASIIYSLDLHKPALIAFALGVGVMVGAWAFGWDEPALAWFKTSLTFTDCMEIDGDKWCRKEDE